MGRKKLGLLATAAVGALSAASMIMAPAAQAVTPTTATIPFECGTYGSGTATLTATQDGTAATITLATDAITAPVAIGAGQIASTLTLTGTSTRTFTGAANPALAYGASVSTGPLTGTVAVGDSLVLSTLHLVVFGFVGIDCTPTGAQSAPFVF